MSNNWNHSSEPSQSPSGLRGEVRRLKANSAATIAELREFLSQTKGRKPQEVMGLVAQSGLAHGMAVSTVLMIGIIAVGTLGPYAWDKVFPAKVVAAAKTQEPAAAPSESTPANAEQAQPSAAPPAATAEQAKPAASDPNEVIDKLGIGETKEFDPKSNPLENKVDDLLKELDKR